MWKRKRDQQAPARNINSYGGNVCPPPKPQATDQELADSADMFTDLITEALASIEEAKRLVLDQDVEAKGPNGTRWHQHYPRFPMMGDSLLDNLIKAQAELIEANRTVAVQGYSVKRRLENAEQGNSEIRSD